MQAEEAAKCLQKHLFLCTDTLKQQKGRSRMPVGAKLQPAIFNYLRHHCQMRYSSQAQNTPLKSNSTSDTLQARPGEKL